MIPYLLGVGLVLFVVAAIAGGMWLRRNIYESVEKTVTLKQCERFAKSTESFRAPMYPGQCSLVKGREHAGAPTSYTINIQGRNGAGKYRDSKLLTGTYNSQGESWEVYRFGVGAMEFQVLERFREILSMLYRVTPKDEVVCTTGVNEYA